MLVFGLVAQGVLLWQTRQQVAALDPTSEPQQSEELSDIEQRLLARLDEQDRQRSQRFSPDPFFGPAFGDPFAEFDRMRQRMQQTMNAFMGGSSFGGAPFSGSSMTFSAGTPQIELEETDEDFRLLIRVPEEHEIALQTDVEDREVTVSGKISSQAGDSGNGFNRQFVSSSQFTRRFSLPGEVDDLKMHTEQDEDGLVIVLPKKDSSSVS